MNRTQESFQALVQSVMRLGWTEKTAEDLVDQMCSNAIRKIDPASATNYTAEASKRQ